MTLTYELNRRQLSSVDPGLYADRMIEFVLRHTDYGDYDHGRDEGGGGARGSSGDEGGEDTEGEADEMALARERALRTRTAAQVQPPPPPRPPAAPTLLGATTQRPSFSDRGQRKASFSPGADSPNGASSASKQSSPAVTSPHSSTRSSQGLQTPPSVSGKAALAGMDKETYRKKDQQRRNLI